MIMEHQCSVTNYLSFKNHLICKYINILTICLSIILVVQRKAKPEFGIYRNDQFTIMGY
jgi:hypothetical protein